MKLLLSICSILTACQAVTVVFDNNRSVAQKYRFSYDEKPSVPDTRIFDKAHCFLENNLTSTDPEKVRKAKRSFLTEMDIIISKDAKRRAKIAENLNSPLYFWIIFNYPTIQEAFELAFTELTAEEAVTVARTYPKYFFQASPVVLEAIPDYSAFSVADVKSELVHHLEGFLLDIESAVKTLKSESLAQALENANYELSSRQLAFIKPRIPELSHLALKDARLIYQFDLLYGEEVTFKSKAKKKKKSNLKSESPSMHPRFKNLICAKKVISMKTELSEPDWKMLVFAYVVYTDTLIEHIFGAIPEFYLDREMFFDAQNFLIDNLNMIIGERVKLLSFGWSEDWQVLLAVPLSKQVRDALAAVDEKTRSILVIEHEVTPQKVQQWLWSQVDFSIFRQKSTREIFNAFKNCFFGPGNDQFARFRGGHISSIFFKHLLFGETLIEPFAKELKHFFEYNANRYIEDFGNIPELVLGTDMLAFKTLHLMYAGADFIWPLKEADMKEQTINDFSRKLRFQQLIQLSISSETLHEALIDALKDPKENNLLMEHMMKYHILYSPASKYPEFFGNRHWEYLMGKGFCPEEFVVNFSGNMIHRFAKVIRLPFSLEKLNRGLHAVPFEAVKEYLIQMNFKLEDSLHFVECLNPQVLKAFEKEASEESVQFFNMLTPWLHFADPLTFDRYKFCEVLTALTGKTRNFRKFEQFVYEFLLKIEMNYWLYRIEPSFTTATVNKNFVLEIELESHIRQVLVDYIAKLLDEAETGPSRLEHLRGLILFGPINPVRAGFLVQMERTCQIALKRLNISIKGNPLDFLEKVVHEIDFYNFVLNNIKSLLSFRNFGENKNPIEIFEISLKVAKEFFEAVRTLPSDHEYCNLLFTLATFESSVEPCKLACAIIPSSLLKDAISGKFGHATASLCNLIVSKRHLKLDNGEFVTQDYEIMYSEYKQFKLEDIKKNVEAAKAN